MSVAAASGTAMLVGRTHTADMLPAAPGEPVTTPAVAVQAFYPAANLLSLTCGFDPDRPPMLRKVTETN